MWYVLGISYANYFQCLDRGLYPQNVWQSSSRTLIEIVKSCLGSEHKINVQTYKNIRARGKDFDINILTISNQRIYDSLAERELDVPKQEREFPEKIKDRYLDHFIRGFFDAHVSCAERQGILRLGIFYNIKFLQRLYSALVGHANVGGGRHITNPPLRLHGQYVSATHDFMYRDWKYIQQRGLYIPSKKARFKI